MVKIIFREIEEIYGIPLWATMIDNLSNEECFDKWEVGILSKPMDIKLTINGKEINFNKFIENVLREYNRHVKEDSKRRFVDFIYDMIAPIDEKMNDFFVFIKEKMYKMFPEFESDD